MKSPKICCGSAPLVFSGKDVHGKPIHSVVCMKCTRDALSGDREYAVHKFNESKKDVSNVKG